MGTIGVSAREAQEARALTAGMIACVDDAIGRVLAALERSGKRDDTVVIFTSDHGDHLGDHRLMLKGAEQYQQHRAGAVHLGRSAGERARQAHRCARFDHGHRRDRAGARQDRAGERHAGARASCRCWTASRCADSVFIQYDHQASSPGTDVPVAGAYADRRALSGERVPRHRLGRALRSRRTIPASSRICGTIRRTAKIRAAMVEKLLLAEIEHVDRVPLPTRRA